MQAANALITDLYQLNMLQAYLEVGETGTAVFEFFVRKLPARRGFLVAAGLEQAMASLDPRSRRIIEARWLREKDTATLHDLAAEFKVSAERIRQIETKALEKMRKVMGDPGGLRALPAPAAN